MSQKFPIISVTGSSGAGTTTVTQTFSRIFNREKINAAIIEGDAFHRFPRNDMKKAMQEAALKGNNNFSHFGHEANLFEELETTFKRYSDTGTTKSRYYIHNEKEAKQHNTPSGYFTDWFDIGEGSDLLLYEGLHGAVKNGDIDIAQHADLKIGVVPVMNLEWIQKIHRDRDSRGYDLKAITDTILRRMPDYLEYICPQFSLTDINFQRVPTVDTSNPPVAGWVPTPDESMVIIRFANPRGIDFTYLQSMLRNSFMSRPNSIVIPGGKMDLAMQLILTPMILRLMERKRKAL
ncbi:MAG: Phosphoribulokinase (EC [uncultured Thiotrichaceae bacterium]|uniref:phosphoribulokinase n=1 Tax=uncultured Thiotrichaceae bacterium TaxID=298394 RepID=A0A6S6TMZ8_9GAMM|nr:MAG: Phosphoribulokinase (EC [uncultured Thiotrichaceae bacterium]